MCGIAGIVCRGRPTFDLRGVAVAMARVQRHRGPDSEGCWMDPARPVALAHQRLAILDLSPAGHQPMLSMSGRYVLSFNGEIYNAPELRNGLVQQGVVFSGHSDTEILLAGIDRWGVDAAVRRSEGMFAFAVWDRQERQLWLARDRVGVKPLYYARLSDGGVAFASEVRAFQCIPTWSATVDPDALHLFLRHGYVPGPHSIFRSTWKLQPGHTLCVGVENAQTQTEPTAYWCARSVIESAADAPRRNIEDVEADLHARLRVAAARQSVADVPLGCFLSGGVDSSLIAAILQSQTTRSLRTFSIGFDSPDLDEAPYARAIAKHLRTDHTEFYVGERDLRDVVQLLPSLCDEPFADSSLIPTYLLCRLARQSVTVALSGDGGDELYFGYDRYVHASRLWRLRNRCPDVLRLLLRHTGNSIAQGHRPTAATLLPWLRGMLRPDTPQEFYRHVISPNRDPAAFLLKGREPHYFLTEPSVLPPQAADLDDYMPYADLMTYLPDDILAKVDRASMAVSLETRVPLLDERILEHALTTPTACKTMGGVRKYLLKRILSRYVPYELFARPKRGFSVPLAEWLRGPLKSWCSDLLDGEALRREGVFRSKAVCEAWRQHLSGSRDNAALLWPVLVFETWRRRAIRE